MKEKVEIDRIRDEEVVDLRLLETLIDEFIAKFAELGCSLEDFYRGYWRSRMEEELYEDERIPRNELDGQREHGVWLTNEKDGDFFDGLWEDGVKRAERAKRKSSRCYEDGFSDESQSSWANDDSASSKGFEYED